MDFPTVNADVTVRNCTITQAPGVCTAVLMRATAGFRVTDTTVVWPDMARTGCRVVHAFNSDGASERNVCKYGNGSKYACDMKAS